MAEMALAAIAASSAAAASSAVSAAKSPRMLRVRLSEELHDVTLVSSDGEEIGSWAVVLRSSSALLRDVLGAAVPAPTPETRARVPLDVRGAVLHAVIKVIHGGGPTSSGAQDPDLMLWMRKRSVSVMDIAKAADYMAIDATSTLYDVLPFSLNSPEQFVEVIVSRLTYGWSSATAVRDATALKRVREVIDFDLRDRESTVILDAVRNDPEFKDDGVLWKRARWTHTTLNTEKLVRRYTALGPSNLDIDMLKDCLKYADPDQFDDIFKKVLASAKRNQAEDLRDAITAITVPGDQITLSKDVVGQLITWGVPSLPQRRPAPAPAPASP